jgi:hypothetical protein
MHPAEARILAGLGTHAGTPDLILIKDGHTYALELKAPGGRLSAAQRCAHEALRNAGATVATTSSLDDSLAVLEGWGLLRGRTQ